MKAYWILISPMVMMSCLFQSSKIQVINNSAVMIDSVYITINNSEPMKLMDIKPGRIKRLFVDESKIVFNKHDVTINVVFFKADSIIGKHGHFNDLYGGLYDSYKIGYWSRDSVRFLNVEAKEY